QRHRRRHGPEDSGHRWSDPLFGRVKQLFEEFLPGPTTDDLVLHVVVGRKTGKAYHAAGDINDLDRLTHIENKNLATSEVLLDSIGGSLERQFDSLTDGHEEALHFRMGDRK